MKLKKIHTKHTPLWGVWEFYIGVKTYVIIKLHNGEVLGVYNVNKQDFKTTLYTI